MHCCMRSNVHTCSMARLPANQLLQLPPLHNIKILVITAGEGRDEAKASPCMSSVPIHLRGQGIRPCRLHTAPATEAAALCPACRCGFRVSSASACVFGLVGGFLAPPFLGPALSSMVRSYRRCLTTTAFGCNSCTVLAHTCVASAMHGADWHGHRLRCGPGTEVIQGL